jgi:hypothetical protein
VPLEKDDDLKKTRKAIIFGFGGLTCNPGLKKIK